MHVHCLRVLSDYSDNASKKPTGKGKRSQQRVSGGPAPPELICYCHKGDSPSSAQASSTAKAKGGSPNPNTVRAASGKTVKKEEGPRDVAALFSSWRMNVPWQNIIRMEVGKGTHQEARRAGMPTAGGSSDPPLFVPFSWELTVHRQDRSRSGMNGDQEWTVGHGRNYHQGGEYDYRQQEMEVGGDAGPRRSQDYLQRCYQQVHGEPPRRGGKTGGDYGEGMDHHENGFSRTEKEKRGNEEEVKKSYMKVEYKKRMMEEEDEDEEE